MNALILSSMHNIIIVHDTEMVMHVAMMNSAA